MTKKPSPLYFLIFRLPYYARATAVMRKTTRNMALRAGPAFFTPEGPHTQKVRCGGLSNITITSPPFGVA